MLSKEVIINMELSPKMYNLLVRPGHLADRIINNIIKKKFPIENKFVLDFGCGIGSSCSMFQPDKYIGVDCDIKRIVYAKAQHPEYNFYFLNTDILPVDENSVDYVLALSVIHHIDENQLHIYLDEFKRILKPDGMVIALEPCFLDRKCFSNLFMRVMDRGKFIHKEHEYRKLFEDHNYIVEIHDRYKQLVLYNKLFFSARPKQYSSRK